MLVVVVVIRNKMNRNMSQNKYTSSNKNAALTRTGWPQVGLERVTVAELQERAAQLTDLVERQRKEMGGLTAAADEETHVSPRPLLLLSGFDYSENTYLALSYDAHILSFPPPF